MNLNEARRLAGLPEVLEVLAEAKTKITHGELSRAQTQITLNTLHAHLTPQQIKVLKTKLHAAGSMKNDGTDEADIGLQDAKNIQNARNELRTAGYTEVKFDDLAEHHSDKVFSVSTNAGFTYLNFPNKPECDAAYRLVKKVINKKLEEV